MTGPDFDELAGEGLEPAERARLERAHEALLRAGPPPELPPELAEPPAPAPVRLLPRRRRAALALVAAALALVVFGAGYLVGDRAGEAPVDRVIVLTGTPAAPGARASLAVFAVDDAGNWPMELTVRGLETLPEGETYELWLTRDGALAESCGVFAVAGETTVVPLNAPYKLKRFDGWVVVRHGESEPLLS